jgi:hypothetical protein
MAWNDVWSEELQESSYNALENVEIVPFAQGFAHLKHAPDYKHATIGLQNALTRDWTIVFDDGTEVKFESLDELLKNGWAVD